MSIKRVVSVTVVISIAAVGLISCGGKAVSNQGYSGTTQVAPTTKAQASAATRGVKLEKEECEEKGLEQGTVREFGIGTADDEAFAVNIALLDARSKMAQQLEVLVSGAITNYNDKYRKGDASSSANKAEMRQEGYFERFLNNTRPICKNTYVKENGDYNVYVTIELDDGIMSQIHKQVSKDAEMDIDFKEHVFKEEMKEMRQKFLEGQR
ncbi:MAG: hypothetical protein LBB56_00450 [Chitinispirillales bacterium]|jgi:hypothetical protein|nr:hypothetical protein [Chitinispirillales bacterium]